MFDQGFLLMLLVNGLILPYPWIAPVHPLVVDWGLLLQEAFCDALCPARAESPRYFFAPPYCFMSSLTTRLGVLGTRF